jgi:hypothetical protein
MSKYEDAMVPVDKAISVKNGMVNIFCTDEQLKTIRTSILTAHAVDLLGYGSKTSKKLEELERGIDK